MQPTSRLAALTAALLLALPIPFLELRAEAQVQGIQGYAEGFEGFAAGAPARTSWFTAVDKLGNAVPVTATPLTGSTRALAFDGTGSSWLSVVSTSRSLDLCTLNSSFSFTIY